ncbi:ADP-ribosylation factor GTPase-activating protein AGD4 [Trifolium repens]|nr:ADP-ribosylation factor GTPase-activating protein AGD4 [Trifolium repens]
MCISFLQSREKFVSLKKNTPEDIVAELEEAENEADRMDWVHKTTGAITSLFNFQFLQQVRSITLDARVWEPTILELLNNLGITYCNSIWEELLLLGDERYAE